MHIITDVYTIEFDVDYMVLNESHEIMISHAVTFVLETLQSEPSLLSWKALFFLTVMSATMHYYNFSNDVDVFIYLFLIFCLFDFFQFRI